MYHLATIETETLPARIDSLDAQIRDAKTCLATLTWRRDEALWLLHTQGRLQFVAPSAQPEPHDEEDFS